MELYRADAKLTEADFCVLKWPGREENLYAFTHYHIAQMEKKPSDSTVLREVVPSTAKAKETLWWSFRQANASVRDAIRFLDRAETIFLRRRRSSAWTTWYFQRRLRAIALSLWSSILELEAPIPFLGVEAALEGMASIADTCVDDAKRVIRNDAYRLATIVDEYSQCAMALRARLILDHSSPRLNERQHRMRDRLVDVVAVLQGVYHERRTVPDGGKYEDWNGRMDECAETYIQEVINACGRRASSLAYVIQ